MYGTRFQLSSDKSLIKVGDKYYYMDTDGAMKTGIVEIMNKLYYFNPDGAMHAPGIFHSEDGTKTYRASEDGSLYRNKADVDLQNNYTVRYDENGVMYTANEHSRLVAEAGGEKFREVMNEENAAERREEDKSLLRAHAYDLMTSLEENYIKRVVGRKGGVKTQRTAEWEAKARKELANFAEESEITSFIHDIEGRSYYKSSDGTYSTLYGEGYEDDWRTDTASTDPRETPCEGTAGDGDDGGKNHDAQDNDGSEEAGSVGNVECLHDHRNDDDHADKTIDNRRNAGQQFDGAADQ